MHIYFAYVYMCVYEMGSQIEYNFFLLIRNLTCFLEIG